jgi:hypothetical protein
MKRSTRSRRTRSNLSASVEQRLTAYAFAAGAAGVGMLAVSQAEAEVVYTPAAVTISLSGPDFYYFNPAPQEQVQGRAPFLMVAGFTSPGIYWDTLSFNPYTSGARFVQGPGTSWSIMPLKKGNVIGPGRRFGSPSRGFIATYGPYGGGTYNRHAGFKFGQTTYIGFKFLINGETHYGWARVTARFDPNTPKRRLSTHLTGYAYETIPDKPILAGEEHGGDASLERVNPATLTKPTLVPASLGVLSLGSPGLSSWRQKSLGAPQ